MAWRADEEVRDDAMWDARPFDSAAAERWLRVVSPPGADARITFAIELRGSRRLVGQTNLTRIDRADQTAYFGIVIGERDCWGRGLGSETLALMLDYAKAIGLRRVLLEVTSTNHRAIGLYRRAGFVDENQPEPRDGVLLMSRLILLEPS
jgi:RimJ/RimL family protein N-acetyltransferase